MTKPSIKRNTIANYIGQAYLALIGIIVTPLYLSYLGAEAYGLVGFFALMQAWMNLLDLGLSPTLGRQAAYARGKESGFDDFKKILKSFELIFFSIGIISIILIYITSGWVAEKWINAAELDSSILVYCIVIMGVIIGLRWLVGLYRSGVNGLEDQVWLNGANMFFTTLKFLGALVILAFISTDIRRFFEYQLLIAICESFIFAYRFYSIMPKTLYSPKLIAFDWISVKTIAPFSLSLAYTAGIWILVTQTDKLILSGILTLSEYGYFSLVALMAGAVTILSGPVSQAILPRLTLLYSQNKESELLSLYSKASQIVTVITLSVSLTIGLYSKPLIYAWTGNTEAAQWGEGVLLWFALGNGILGISAYQYYLQMAFGQLKLHVIGSTISALLQLPLIYYAAVNYGAKGAGIAWFGFRLIWFIWWTPIIHIRFLPGFHMNWLLKEILPIVAIASITTLSIHYSISLDMTQNRFLLFMEMVGIGFTVLVITAFSSVFIRQSLIKNFKRNF